MNDALIGQTLSHFRILEKVGGGGMGVVYRARDEQLRRDVAIKVLAPEILADEVARRRFRHEALVLSRLNHPNVETIFGFETQDGIDFLIVEYVGELSLESRLRSGPVPEDEAITIAVSIAGALEAAHAKGVIHCDLKPGNVGLTPDGRVKVLDFGIARVLRLQRDDSTLTVLDHIECGGTLPYMAPEQLLGKRIDVRVDLYALGVLLFRMVAGRVPFCQALQTALVEDILHEPPPSPRALNPKVSARLEAIILRCLEKDPANRYQTAADLSADLGRLKRDSELIALGGVPVGGRPHVNTRKRPRRGALPMSLALGALAVGWLIVSRQHTTILPLPPDRQVTFTGEASEPAISPDGMYAAYVDRSVTNQHRLLVQDLAGGEALQVFTASVCILPRWSPDGASILCQAVRESREAAFLVPKLGGASRALPAAGPLHSWAPDSKRFVSASSTARRLLFTDTATGDTSSVALEGLPDRIVDLDWSPRGDRIVLLAADDRGRSSFWLVAPGEARPRKCFDDSSRVLSTRWCPGGEAVYFLRVTGQGGLVDLCKSRLASRSRRSSPQVEVLLRGLEAGDYFTVSADGRRLLYTRTVARSNLWRVDLRRRSIPDRGTPLTTGTTYDWSPAVSPDGEWVAFARVAGPSAEIFRIPMDGGEAQRLTFMNAVCQTPVWSASGDTIAFISDEGGNHRLWRVAAKGGPARPYPGIEVSDRPFAPLAWAPGAALLCETAGNRDYLLLDTRSGRSTSMGSPDSLGWIIRPQFSPDGARVAWWTPEPRGVWIMTLANRERVRVMRDGPVIPLSWTTDGGFIYAADLRAARPRLLRFPSTGGTGESHYEIPIAGSVSEVSTSSNEARVVCSVGSQQPDVWLAEDFDRGEK